MFRPAISLCGSRYPTAPCVHSLIRSKWIDISLAVGIAVVLTFSLLATYEIFPTMETSQAASFSYGLYGCTAALTALLLTKFVCRFLITHIYDKKGFRIQKMSSELLPDIRKGNNSWVALNNRPGETFSFSNVVTAIFLEPVDGTILCSLSFSDRRIKPRSALMSQSEAFALVQGLDSNKCNVGNYDTTADRYFEYFDKSKWPIHDTATVFAKHFQI